MGSPRKEGNSAILARQVATGAKEAGADVESFFLHGMDIKPCDACEACRGKTETDCISTMTCRRYFPSFGGPMRLLSPARSTGLRFRPNQDVHGPLVFAGRAGGVRSPGGRGLELS